MAEQSGSRLISVTGFWGYLLAALIVVVVILVIIASFVSDFIDILDLF